MTDTHGSACAYVRVYIHACMHTCIHTYKTTYMHTYIHARIHTDIQMISRAGLPLPHQRQDLVSKLLWDAQQRPTGSTLFLRIPNDTCTIIFVWNTGLSSSWCLSLEATTSVNPNEANKVSETASLPGHRRRPRCKGLGAFVKSSTSCKGLPVGSGLAHWAMHSP